MSAGIVTHSLHFPQHLFPSQHAPERLLDGTTFIDDNTAVPLGMAMGQMTETRLEPQDCHQRTQVLVGAPGDGPDRRAAYIYGREGSKWPEVLNIVPGVSVDWGEGTR